MVGRESIYVYRLFPPERLASEKEALLEILFGSAPAGGDLRISPLTGAISYRDPSAMWLNSDPASLPASPAAAEKMARRFLEEADRRLADSRLARGVTGLSSLFPKRLESAGGQLMYRPPVGDQPVAVPLVPDHWICTFVPSLRTGGFHTPGTAPPPAPPPAWPSANLAEPDAPVNNGSIEVRVGAGGRVVGLISRWRPVRSFELVPRLPPPHHDDNPAAPPPRIFYWLAGEDVPQPILGPYYLSTGSDPGEHGEIFPASGYSLLVAVVVESSAEGASLRAVTAGNTGELQYSWGTLRLDEEAGFEPLGSGPAIRVPPGCHNIVLDALDPLTGAFARTQRIVVTG